MFFHSNTIRYFHAVATSGSIRSASSQLHISPSAVYRKIQELEDKLGIALFLRSSRGVELTHAGKILAAHVERTLADAEHTIEKIAARPIGQSPILVAGNYSCIAEIISPAFTQFRATHSEISTIFSGCSSEDAQDLLVRGAADIAVIFDPSAHPDIVIHSEARLPVGAVMPPEHELAHAGNMTLEMCSGFPLILPDQTWALRSRLDEHFANLSKAPEIVSASSSVDLMVHMVSQRLGIGLQTVVGLLSAIENGKVEFKQLAGAGAFTQRLAVCTHRKKPLSHNAELLLNGILSGAGRYQRRS